MLSYKKIFHIKALALFILFSNITLADNHNLNEVLELIQKDLKTLEKAVYSGSINTSNLSNQENFDQSSEDVLTRHLLKLSDIENQFQELTNKFEEINLDNLDLKDLPELEKFMLNRVYSLNERFLKYFKNYDFHNLYKELLNFCTVDLSAFYFDIRKDTLYCDTLNSDKRKSCILVLNILLNSLLRWFAPILSFTTEEIYQLVSKKNKSIHLEKFLDFPKNFKNQELYIKWMELIRIRDICNMSIEEKRASKEIGSSLEASLKIKISKQLFDITKNIDFAELCITSHAEILEHKDDTIKVTTIKAKGDKCPVCWKIIEGSCSRHPQSKI